MKTLYLALIALTAVFFVAKAQYMTFYLTPGSAISLYIQPNISQCTAYAVNSPGLSGHVYVLNATCSGSGAPNITFCGGDSGTDIPCAQLEQGGLPSGVCNYWVGNSSQTWGYEYQYSVFANVAGYTYDTLYLSCNQNIPSSPPLTPFSTPLNPPPVTLQPATDTPTTPSPGASASSLALSTLAVVAAIVLAVF